MAQERRADADAKGKKKPAGRKIAGKGDRLSESDPGSEPRHGLRSGFASTNA
jgi:hypothetical protein